MFGTLRYGAEGSRDDSNNVQLKSARATAGSFPNTSACEPCKRKKHRCDSEKPTCGRCKNVNGTYTYQSPASSTERRRKAAHASRARRESQALNPVLNDPVAGIDQPMTASEASSELHTDEIETVYHNTSHESSKSLSIPSTILTVSESEQMLLQARGIGIGEDTWNQFIAYPSTPYISTTPPPSSTGSGTPSDSFGNKTHPASPKSNSMLPFGLANLDIDTALTSHSWTAAQCSCLAMLLALLDDASNRLLRIEEESLCEALKYIKQAFGHIKELFGCSSCMMRSDYSMLLAVVTARLTELVEKVAIVLEAPLLLNKDGEGGNLGSYPLTADEYECLSRTLFRYHVEKYSDLVRRMKQMATTTGRGAQISQFKDSEKRLLSVFKGKNYT